MTQLTEPEVKELRKACQLVENVCRSLGKDCTVVFGLTVVSVAPPAWAGDSTGPNFFEALQDALEGGCYACGGSGGEA